MQVRKRNSCPSYAPTKEKTDEVKVDFYIRLEEVIRTVKQHDKRLPMGDFNAKIGRDDEM